MSPSIKEVRGILFANEIKVLILVKSAKAMARKQLAIGLDGSTFKILYIYYCAYLMDKSIGIENFRGLGMRDFYGRGSPIAIGWNTLSKTFKYLRNNGLITRAFYWGKYTISEKGIQVLYETLLKRQALGLTYEVNGIYLVADPDTKQIIVMENVNKSTNLGHTGIRED